MEDEEERLFSIIDEEDLEQKEFARRDYEGLTEAQQRVLKRHRSQYAKDLNEARNLRSASNIKKTLVDNGWEGINTNTNISGGGISTDINVETIANKLDNYDTLSRRHANKFRDEAIKQANASKKIMRESIEKGLYDDEVRSVEKASKRLKNIKTKKTAEEAAKKATENTAKTTTQQASKTAAKETAEEVVKKGSRLGKGGKIALGLTGAAALGYGAKKAYDHYKNKKNKK